MKALVIFDTNFGHTKLIADKIAGGLGKGVKSISVNNLDGSNLTGLELVVVGSPIIGWKPTEKIMNFLKKLSKDQLKGVKSTSFDTRVKLFIHGDAANKISRVLEGIGAEIVVKPQAFFVKGKEGPLFDGELERAQSWGELIKSKIK